MNPPFADQTTLKAALEGSWYFIAGTGDPLSEWITGYEDLMKQENIGTPTRWVQTNGGTINAFAMSERGPIHPNDQFKGDLTCLLFPLNDLDIGGLAIFRLRMQDRWFDDVIANMRRA